MTEIHSTASVAPGATIGAGCRIGPGCVVGPDVVLEDGVELIAHVVVDGHTRLGAGVKVFPFATVGMAPQDLKYKNEPTRCEIGAGETVSVYTFTAPAAGMWRFATSDLMGGDSILSVRSACATPVPIGVLACNDDGAGNLASQADVELAAGQTVYVGVYGFAPGRDGPFTLTVSLRP